MRKYIPNKSAIVLMLYMVAVWTSYVYTNVTDKVIHVLLLALLFAWMSYFAGGFLLRRIEQWNFSAKNECNRKKNLAVFAVSTVLCLLVLLVWFAAYYPGSFSPDSVDQYRQVVSGIYDDWHPVWHTVVFFTLPVSVTGNVSSVVLFQICCFSLVMGYITMVIAKHAGMKAAVVAGLYVILSPYTGNIVLYPWKDVGFAMAGALGMAMAAQIYFSKSRWSQKLWKVIALGVVLANATIFRHNGILFTAPLVLALFFHMTKKQWLQLLVTFVLTVVVIKGPVYYLLGVEQSNTKVIETVGLPMTVIANVAKVTPERMDEELSDFVYSIAPQELWESRYYCGNFNAIKWAGIDTEIVEEKGAGYVLKMMFKCFKLSPKASIQAFCALSDLVYGIEGVQDGNIGFGIANNEFGIAYDGNVELVEMIRSYSIFVDSTLFHYVRITGVALLAMLIVILGKLKWKSWESWKTTLLCLPIFAYDFGTMLLLTGPDSRFFYITFMVCPLVMILALLRREEINNG